MFCFTYLTVHFDFFFLSFQMEPTIQAQRKMAVWKPPNAGIQDRNDVGCSKRFLTQGTNRWEEMLNTFTYTHHLHATDRSEFPNNLYSHWSGSKWIWTVLHFACYFFFVCFFLLCKHVGATWRCRPCQHDITVTLAHSVLNNIQWSRKEHYKIITARRKAVL